MFLQIIWFKAHFWVLLMPIWTHGPLHLWFVSDANSWFTLRLLVKYSQKTAFQLDFCPLEMEFPHIDMGIQHLDMCLFYTGQISKTPLLPMIRVQHQYEKGIFWVFYSQFLCDLQ